MVGVMVTVGERVRVIVMVMVGLECESQHSANLL